MGALVINRDGRVTAWDGAAAAMLAPMLGERLVPGVTFAELERSVPGCAALRFERRALSDGSAVCLCVPARTDVQDVAADLAASPLFARNPAPMWLFGSNDRRVAAVNDAAVALFGCRREDIVGKRTDELCAAAPSLDGVSDLWRPCRSDGAEIDLLISEAPLAPDGRPLVLAAAQDVTALRRAEARLIAARRQAERVSRVRDRFFAVANHDLRQPLAALALFVGALENRLNDPNSREILRAMNSSLLMIKGLVDAHLDFARLDVGEMEVEPVDHSVNGLMMRMALEFAPQAEEKGLELHVEPCSAVIRSDRALLERILRNLLSNAIRYTERGRVLLGCRRRGDRLRVEVWDTGRGIPQDQVDIIFEDFFRGPADRGYSGAGFGLGLAVVERLARRLGHPVEVRSKIGRGSCFAVTVPLGLDIDERPPPPAAPEPDVSRARVVAIDDDEVVLQALELLLGQWGCEVIAALSAEEATAHIASSGVTPDLIIADFQLSGSANGIVAIRQIAKLLGTNVPGLIVTGDTDSRRLREAKLSGYPLLHKPVSALALRAAVANLLGRERLLG